MNVSDGAVDGVCYEIQVKGQLDLKWADWFAPLDITHAAGHTLLSGPVADQSALLGLLLKLHDLGLIVITMNPVKTAEL